MRITQIAPLLKGVEVGPYKLNVKLSQGEREWFDDTAFHAEGHARPVANKRRIATQRITGVDERLRIVAMTVDPTTYFADSTNSIAVLDSSEYSLEYLLGLLNSRLFQWRFKLTSTNNNVGTNELLALPIRRIDFTDKVDAARHTKMHELVLDAINLRRDLNKTKAEQSRVIIERQILSVERQIDLLVYEIYGLTEKDIAIVNGSKSQ